MGTLTLLALRIVLGMVLAGSLFVQAVIGGDLADVPAPLGVFMVLGIVTVQVSTVCVWRLLTMVRRGTVFSHAAFRYVDIVFGAVTTASLLALGLAVALAPGEAPPGIVFLICGAALLAAGIALIVLVLRMLLAQAVARDKEAHHLQAELDEVI
ncbi:MAG: Putative transmembrane transport protein [uncultured Thermomicrobiales bacterium]|uniref:Transmembrane transport protein n=1 Tax=uncultured Thermomicrobiales bacterium TaxID=1645740 RepID=A0A6J4UQY9_9BACT|nr:MAG: Putative transmembrane transport protein [uncultured Thermomicrobiales bacterium]